MRNIGKNTIIGLLTILLATVCIPKVAEAASWMRNNVGWWWQEDDGNYPVSEWKTINGKRYYFDEQGYMKTGWFWDGRDWYYLGNTDDGAMKTGWCKVGNEWYYLDKETGKMQTGWLSEGNELYCLQSSGAMLANKWILTDAGWYYLGVNGNAITGWVWTNGYWYYLGQNKLMVENQWINDGSGWYYLGAGGRMHTGWIYENDWYFLGSNGALVLNGWAYDGSNWYYMGTDGRMVTGWQLISGTWYKFAESGSMMSGWLYEGGVWYYLGHADDGAMAVGGRCVNGTVYVFDNSGAMYANGTYTRNGCTFTADASGAVSSCYTSGFPVVLQRPELPTGCEITALTMVLNYYGYPVSKTTMASSYLPTVASGYTGNVDLDYYFCGNPYGSGIGCGAGALVTAANSYLYSYGSTLRGIDLTGASSGDVLARVAGGQPAVTMVTIGMAQRKTAYGWSTPSGKYVSWSENDHGVAVIGWDSSTVTVACPLFGIKTYTKAQFEYAYAARGNKAMILQ